MSRHRWAVWLGPPLARRAGVTVVLAGALIGCYGARPTASPAASLPLGSVAPGASDSVIAGPPRAVGLIGKTWLAEGPNGWEAGRIGGRRISLGEAEVGIAVSDRWIVSAVLSSSSTTLVVRDGPAADPSTIDLGGVAPTATVIVGDRAYASGFSFAQSDDPGILEIELEGGTVGTLLPGSGAVGTRYVVASPDGSTLVSSLCDLEPDPEPDTCSLWVVSLADGTVTYLGDVPGGLLRGTSPEVAVVAPQGPEPPGWLAGIDLHTGKELWRVAGGEFGPSVMNPERGLIQQRLHTDGPKPRLVIEAIDLRKGTSELVYEETRGAPGDLWPALSSDTAIAVGEDGTVSRAIAGGSDAHARVRLVPIDGGDPVDVDVSLRNEP